MIVKMQTALINDIDYIIEAANERPAFTKTLATAGSYYFVVRSTMRGLIQFEIWAGGPQQVLAVAELNSANQWQARLVNLDRLDAFNAEVRRIFGAEYCLAAATVEIVEIE